MWGKRYLSSLHYLHPIDVLTPQTPMLSRIDVCKHFPPIFLFYIHVVFVLWDMLDELREMQSRNGRTVAITGGQEFLNTLERGWDPLSRLLGLQRPLNSDTTVALTARRPTRRESEIGLSKRSDDYFLATERHPLPLFPPCIMRYA